MGRSERRTAQRKAKNAAALSAAEPTLELGKESLDFEAIRETPMSRTTEEVSTADESSADLSHEQYIPQWQQELNDEGFSPGTPSPLMYPASLVPTSASMEMLILPDACPQLQFQNCSGLDGCMTFPALYDPQSGMLIPAWCLQNGFMNGFSMDQAMEPMHMMLDAEADSGFVMSGWQAEGEGEDEIQKWPQIDEREASHLDEECCEMPLPSRSRRRDRQRDREEALRPADASHEDCCLHDEAAAVDSSTRFSSFGGFDENGLPTFTTVMLRNVPNKYTRDMLVQVLKEDFENEFNFVYLPIDFKNGCNIGYGFVNFTNYEACGRFVTSFDGVEVQKCLPGLQSRKVAEVRPARVQGFEENVQRLRSSPVMGELLKNPDWMPLLLDSRGEEMAFPMPEQPIPAVRPRGRAKKDDRHRSDNGSDGEATECSSVPHH